jgi:hypothetical protein
VVGVRQVCRPNTGVSCREPCRGDPVWWCRRVAASAGQGVAGLIDMGVDLVASGDHGEVGGVVEQAEGAQSVDEPVLYLGEPFTGIEQVDQLVAAEAVDGGHGVVLPVSSGIGRRSSSGR